MRISYSSLKTYQTCPLQYKYKYIDKLPEKIRPELVFGKFIHRILFLVLNHREALPPNAQGLKKAKKILGDEWPAQHLGKKEKQLRLKADLLLEKFFKSFNPLAQQIVSAEEKFAVPLGDHTLSGIIDRIDKTPDGKLEVIDYKTGRLSSQEGIHQNQQLTFYYQATKARFPDFKEIRLSLHFLENDIKFSSQRGKADVLTLKSTIDQTSEQIDKSNFPPKIGPLCRFCDYNQICPAWLRLPRREFAKNQKNGFRLPVNKTQNGLDSVEKELDWESLTQMSLL